MLIVMIKICYTPFKIIGLKTSTILYFPNHYEVFLLHLVVEHVQ